ncbi:glutathione S-transferase family protein [Sphingomonadales bacterium 56]|uniref:Glutathione S-transferase family protein n=1 Tax=Sphingobium indicum TaxID=332055 RepID=A0A4V1W9P5_9SPHN|nr:MULTISPECIES: glutathione S-transferase family protein [Sphingobium]MBY2930665.1 glutathione S-transferase family protein [Sphingomonadales bacterium 56]MBY2960657.1 glutathione S-transferase family protein [Sphingomonadales bacterium 58]NYI23867.1 putative glutathione S-transferase [Sphingobium indicum]RYM00287.1 glutathione S-transferase family protein [Sphingobium indicum]CAD7341653.1 Glutathionyl-hydroquinone reductase PcpF [Sphingobium sp. S8]
MGLLVDGVWRDAWYDTKSSGGRFVRKESQYRDGLDGRFQAEPGRYHIYAGFACPWAHRVLIMRALKGLEGLISVSMVNAFMGEKGWTFLPGEGVVPDSVNGAQYLYQVYLAGDPTYTGRVTIPILWDKFEKRIVNNESSEIIRILNSAFDHVGALPGDYYPQELRAEIDAINARVYETLNNGVYRSGFATTQEAYEEAVHPLFETLDWLEEHLTGREWLVGDRLTEADIRLFTTLVRFDAIYHGHFKCNLRRIADYPNLSRLTWKLASHERVAPTIDLRHAKAHYYRSHTSVNPTGIVPVGPAEPLGPGHSPTGIQPLPA